MNFNSKRSVTDEQNERHKRLLASILKEEGNKSCADCKTRNPTWASVNLGVFVCLTCSGIHRSLGVHISQVRSCNLDTWLPKQVEFCRVMGNVKGNRYWEARLPKDFRRPPSGNPNPELASFIRAKYVDRAFAATDSQPPTIDNYLDNKYAAQDESSAPAAVPAAAPPAAPQAPSGPPLRLTPSKASASSPALTVDLLGGFDDVRPTNPAPVLPTSPSAANSDPFSYGSFVSAPAPVPQPAAGNSIQRNSLEWSDFCAAAPTAAASQPNQPAALLQSQLSSHHRSHSITEGIPASNGLATNQPSRMGQDPHRQQHNRTHSHAANDLDLFNSNHTNHHTNHLNHHSQKHMPGHAGHPSPSSAPPHPVGSSAAAADPFAPQPGSAAAAAPDDLLAGLTIHHIMETMAPQPTEENGSVGGVAASADPFQFSSSALPGEHKPLGRGSGHRRHPSNMKSSEEILRLFDTAPSTGAAAAAATGGALDDPFGDFLGASTATRAPTTTATVVVAAPEKPRAVAPAAAHVGVCDVGVSFGLTANSGGGLVHNLL